MASTAALQMQVVGIGWQIYALTGSALDLGLVGLVQFLPAFLLILLIGHVADRYDRAMIVRIAQIAEGLAAAVLAIGTALNMLDRDGILALVFLLGTARAFEAPTLQALLPGLVPLPLFPRAVAGSASANQIASIAGPAIGGLIYIISPTLLYGACAALFFGASILISLIRTRRAVPPREPVNVKLLFAGIAYIRRNPIILGAISLDLFAVLLGGVTALLPIFARDIFSAGPLALGLLRAAPAVGALTMALALARWPLRARVGRKMFVAVAVFGAATIVFALSQSFLLSLTALFVLGAADMISVVVRVTLVQLETPDAMRGRVTAVNMLFVGTSNQLGEFESGVTAALFGAVGSVLIGGIGTLLIVALWARLFPQLLHADRLSNSPR